MPHPLPRYHDNDVTPPSTESAKRGDWIAVLPLGAHEQHGPHLPFETDTLIAQGLVDRIIPALPADLPVTFLPVEPIAVAYEVNGGAIVALGETERLLDLPVDDAPVSVVNDDEGRLWVGVPQASGGSRFVVLARR